MSQLSGNAEAIERIAYELCEDQANSGVAYFEVRYTPLTMTGSYRGDKLDTMTPQEVIDAVTLGLSRGRHDFGVKSNQIMVLLDYLKDRNEELLGLIMANRDKGIVGVDVAGDEKSGGMFDESIVNVFTQAKASGLGRTVHAAECGPAVNVEHALDDLHAQRIGHGYRVLEDAATYGRCLEGGVHFECCPYSSMDTGSVTTTTNGGKHPIVQFAEDEANFSISRDDPTITGSSLSDEYSFLMQLGLTEAHIVRANMNAARSAFLPETEKDLLIRNIITQYGI
ncbi:Adenosine deaminase [Halotydeus destructor]|nr:Adenosine deaminase [Halotydeus destructor]